MKLLLPILLFFNLHYCFAQDSTGKPSPTCLQDRFCNFALSDVDSTPFNSVATDLNINYGKYNASATYPGDVKYQDENDGCTAAATTCTNIDNGVLHYDVYYPSDYTKAQYLQCRLPVVVFVHGGGFSDCNVLNPGGSNPDAKAFAKR